MMQISAPPPQKLHPPHTSDVSPPEKELTMMQISVLAKTPPFTHERRLPTRKRTHYDAAVPGTLYEHEEGGRVVGNVQVEHRFPRLLLFLLRIVKWVIICRTETYQICTVMYLNFAVHVLQFDISAMSIQR